MRTNHILFDAPASCWTEALPIGNGKMGAMIYGTPYTDLIQLNEDSVWGCGPRDRNNPDALKNLDTIRRYIREGEVRKAQDLASMALTGIPDQQAHYEPLANLYLQYDGFEDAITDYRRELSLDDACARVTYTRGGVRHRNEYFASYPDNMIVIKLTTDTPGGLSFYSQLARGEASDRWGLGPREAGSLRNLGYNTNLDGIKAIDSGTQLLTATCSGKDGIRLATATSHFVKGGKCYAIGSGIRVENADEVIILVTAITSYRSEDPERDVIPKSIHEAILSLGKEKEPDHFLSLLHQYLWNRHLEDYKALYNRVTLSINPNSDQSAAFEDLPTPARLKALQEGAKDDDLCELLFQYGRYLLIASSRPGSLPANLQGVWNKDFNPAWGSKYTININTEMNYWPAEICNLSECHEPLLAHTARMIAPGQITAQKMYGCRGAVAHHNTDLWCDTAPQDMCISASYWVMGLAWLSLHIWEHYQYTKDIEELRNSFFIMAEAARFLLDFLVEEDGYLVITPSLSPENEYVVDDKVKGVLCSGATMDNEILTELFGACLKTIDLLRESPLSEEECHGLDDLLDLASFEKELHDALGRLCPLRIGKHGQIQEWNVDYEEIDPGHRHISQLFALHPGSGITVQGTPELAAAARATLYRRLENGGGHTGWSRAWIINMWARLGDGDQACNHLIALLKKSMNPNLFDDHPPFQIDGNFGAASGIAQMLLQSHEGDIHLLPALPTAWESGSVTGLCARGGVTVDISWEKGILTKTVITSKCSGTATVRYRNERKECAFTSGEPVTITF